ncbi:MAG TPA: AAA family ATPase [Streptosporangiaceae bacterium]|nr:AAA family ATPase [Streptosporangiaceae bacterium]
MTRLIVLNGPPGCGKSTLAALYADGHPLVLNLDIDQVRASIGGWRDDRHNAGLLARSIALAAARVHLTAGHDVIIPQFLGRPEFLIQLEKLAGECAAGFAEVVLLDSRENVLGRFAGRAADPAQPRIQHATGAVELAEMYDRLLALLPSRPAAVIVPVAAGQVEQAYQDLLRALAPAGDSA